MIYYNIFDQGRNKQLVSNFGQNKINQKEVNGRQIAVNILHAEKETILEMAIPGFKKEQIKIRLEEALLIVEGNIQKKETEETIRYIKKGFSLAEFSRKFKVAEEMDLEKIAADFQDGILRISIPEKENLLKSIKKDIMIS